MEFKNGDYSFSERVKNSRPIFISITDKWLFLLGTILIYLACVGTCVCNFEEKERKQRGWLI